MSHLCLLHCTICLISYEKPILYNYISCIFSANFTVLKGESQTKLSVYIDTREEEDPTGEVCDLGSSLRTINLLNTLGASTFTKQILQNTGSLGHSNQ